MANLFIPQRQLAVSAQSSSPAGRTPGVVYAWWVSFVLLSVLTAIGSTIRPSDDELFSPSLVEDFQTADRIHGAGMAMGAVAAVFGLLTIQACTKAQQQLAGQRAASAGQAPAGPPPMTF